MGYQPNHTNMVLLIAAVLVVGIIGITATFVESNAAPSLGLSRAKFRAASAHSSSSSSRKLQPSLGLSRANLRAASAHSSSSSSSSRKLQLGTGVLDRYQVGQSTIDFDGMHVKLVYPLSDLVPDDSVSVKTFSDVDCTVDISDNDYLFHEITYDDNPNPTGEKNREVTVTYTFDPAEIQGEDVWIEKEDNSVFLSFCTAIILHTGALSDPSSGPMTSLDTVVYLQVEFEGGFAEEFPVGPADRLNENAQEMYKVDGFICDESNEALDMNKPMVQGERVRVCVKPTDRALGDGIFMRQVDSFTFYRVKDDGSEVTQIALTDGMSANPELTDITCPRGSTICWFETLLKADFYFKPGIIFGYGEAWLQV